MTSRTRAEYKLIDKLITDCITYDLKPKEALRYIEIEFKPISESNYWTRRSKLQSKNHVQAWLNQFTKIGFVRHHKKQMENLEKVQADRLRQFFIETNRNQRDEKKISQLNYDIRENARLLSELGLGTPIISAIKAKLETNAKTVQGSEPIPLR